MSISKKQQEAILNKLKKDLDHSEELWKSKAQSDAYIIGYLQGAIKIAIAELEG